MQPIIKLDDGRNKLGEGRTWGIGFGFLKKLADGTYLGVSPISPCKDYLNDVVYSEQTGKPFSACGLKTKKNDIFDDFAYLAFATCHHNRGVTYGSYYDEVKLLDENLINTQKVLNDIEKMLGFKDFTELVSAQSNLVFAKISKDWVSSTWMISLWSFLARNAVYSTGGDAFTELRATKMDDESIEPVIKCIEKISKEGLPKQDFSNIDCVHSCGILNYLRNP